MFKKIKIYSVNPENHASPSLWQKYLIHPLKYFYGDGSVDWSKYEASFKYFDNLYELIDSEFDADIHLLPFSVNYYYENSCFQLVLDSYLLADSLEKKLLIWIDGDFDLKIHLKNAVYLKFASFKSKKIANEIIRSGDMKYDLLEQYFNNKLIIRKKHKRPLVGFDGLASYSNAKLFRLIAKNSFLKIISILRSNGFEQPPVVPLLIKRNKILKRISANNNIDTDFKIRNNFAYGIRTNNLTARQEFINNIYNTDYTLCIRGGSNYSLRLYETMCLGRIPLFLNTDCVLPFENKIDWKFALAWIEESDENRIAEALLDFHMSLTNKDFEDKQRYCREIWFNYLRKESYESELVIHLLNNFINN